MSEGLTDDHIDEPVYRVGEEHSTFGSLPVEEYIRKGQEIRSSLERILADIRFSSAALEDVDIAVSLLGDLRLAVIPRTPLKVKHEKYKHREETLEPAIIEQVAGKVLKDKSGKFSLSLEGSVEGSPDTKIEFDPLAGHDLLAIEPNTVPGVRREGGVRLTSGYNDGHHTLEFIVY